MRLLVTAMKNEGPFILEWAAYHLSVGFDQFLVYTNDCDDGTDAIWARLTEMGFGAHVVNDRIKQRGVQKTTLMRADDHPLRAGAEWISCLDCDEFLNIRRGDGSLDDLFAQTPDAHVHMISWRRFGAAGHIGYTDKPVTEQFTRAAPENCPYPFHNYGLKSIWRGDAPYARIGVHRPLDPDPARLGDIKVVNGAGQELPLYRDKQLWLTPQIAGYEGAQINHYALRSAQSFLVKRDRGLPNSKVTDLDLSYWAERNFNTIEETSIARRLPAMHAKLAMLKADDQLASLHEGAMNWHLSRIGDLMDQPETLKLFLQLIATETGVVPPVMARRLNPLIAKSWEADRARRRAERKGQKPRTT